MAVILVCDDKYLMIIMKHYFQVSDDEIWTSMY